MKQQNAMKYWERWTGVEVFYQVIQLAKFSNLTRQYRKRGLSEQLPEASLDLWTIVSKELKLGKENNFLSWSHHVKIV